MASDALRESALLWVKRNTTLEVDPENIPADVEMFIEKYGEIMSLRPGVTSESIGGHLSQSFTGGDIAALLRQYAGELLGEDCLGSSVEVFPAADRWVY